MPDPLFQTLFDETETMTWAPTEVVRDRAHRRVRRTRVAAVAAALVAVGVVSGGVAVAQRGQSAGPQPGTSRQATEPPLSSPPAPSSSAAPPPSTASTPPSTPEGTAIVDALFLPPGDVGPGYRVVNGREGSGDWTFEFTSSVLGCQPSSISPVTRQDRLLSRGTPQAEDNLSQYVARYRPGDAARYLDQARARVNACQPGGGRTVKIGAQRFAGQDALLIEVDYGDGFTTKHLMVRQGDLLTEFATKPALDSAAAQELARKAATRLCAATPVC
jgi:hypothetical protein